MNKYLYFKEVVGPVTNTASGASDKTITLTNANFGKVPANFAAADAVTGGIVVTVTFAAANSDVKGSSYTSADSTEGEVLTVLATGLSMSGGVLTVETTGDADAGGVDLSAGDIVTVTQPEFVSGKAAAYPVDRFLGVDKVSNTSTVIRFKAINGDVTKDDEVVFTYSAASKNFTDISVKIANEITSIGRDRNPVVTVFDAQNNTGILSSGLTEPISTMLINHNTAD